MIRWDGLLKLMVPPWVQILADPSRLKILKDGTVYWNWWCLPECIYDSQLSPRIRSNQQAADPRILIDEVFFLQDWSRSVFQPLNIDLIPTPKKWFDILKYLLPPKNREQLKILSGKGNVETTVCLFLIRLFVLFLLHEQYKLPVHLCRPRWPQQSDGG